MNSYVLTFQCHCRQQIGTQNKDRIVTEACGHSKCRSCFIKEESGCVKCFSLKTSGDEHRPISDRKIKNVFQTNDMIEKILLPTIKKLDNVTGRVSDDELGDRPHYTQIVDEASRKICPNRDVIITKKAASLIQLKKPKDIRVLEEVIIKPFVEIPSNACVGFTIPRMKEQQKLNYPSHITWETVNGRTEFKCKICNKSFRSKSNRRYHFYCDETIEKPFSCSKCPKTFATKNHLKYHESRHENIQHNCKECSRSFLSRVSLQKHLKMHKSDFKYICDHCDTKFYNKSDLVLHMYSHKKLPLPFQCDSCDKAFSAKFKLNQHIETHKEVKAHSCQLCGKKFSRNSTLTIHMLTHSSLDTKYECKLCLKSFDRQRSYDRHMKIKHGSTVFRCPLCDVQSGRKDNILRHIRNLHSDKSFDEIIKKISKSVARHKITETKKTATIPKIKPANEFKIVENSTVVCQYQSVIKFAGRSEPPPQPIRLSEDCSDDPVVPSNEKVNSCKTTDDQSDKTSKTDKSVQKKYCNELRVELAEPSGREQKISNINIYRQLLSPYLRPPPNLESRNGTQEKHRGFQVQSDSLVMRNKNVDIYRSILMSDHDQQTDNSVDAQNNSKLPNNKIEPLVIHCQNSDFSEMHWRKRASQSFNQME